MKTKTIAALGALALALLAPAAANAAATPALAQVNISPVPLLNIQGTGAAKPNLMLLFDNSGSMDQAYTPDYVDDNLCRSGATLQDGATSCYAGHAPFMSPDFNKQYYNPTISYTPPIKDDGITYYPSMTTGNTNGWTNVTNDGFNSKALNLYQQGNVTKLPGLISASINLVSAFPDIQWCDSNGNHCAWNTTTYTYPDANHTNDYLKFSAPYYYTIGVGEWCNTKDLTTCVGGTVGAAAPSGYSFPAKVRWCTDTSLGTCQAKRVGSFLYPRFSTPSNGASTFVRTDIVPTRTTYPFVKTRVDCKAVTNSCSYDEEMTNFANWNAYYKTRIQMMKTAIGSAFAPLTASYRVGFVNLSTAEDDSTTDARGRSRTLIEIFPTDFTPTARTAWYQALYSTTTSGSTPIRTAMHNVGKMFANQSPYNLPVGQEVVQYPCQQNFEILTTDGYWNGGAPPSSTAIPPATTPTGPANNDNVEDTTRFCTKARGCVDARAQSLPSISDVALYWYNGGSNTSTVSLRPSLEPDMTVPGLVSTSPGENTHLHVNMFTLGLGVDGVMTYEKGYDTAPTVGGDFYNLISGTTTGCSWNGGKAYVWPDPNVTSTASTVQERVDDLWHAAVNGHGKYFSAANPSQVVSGLSEAITKLNATVGAAAAAATSTPNITQQNRDVYADTFTTVKWYGELTDSLIDPITGKIGTTPLWSTSTRLGTQVQPSTDTRKIYWLDASGTTPVLSDFKYASLGATEKGWFANKCVVLTQCGQMTSAQQLVANSGDNLVNWLRGQQQYADNAIFRGYTASPAVAGTPSVPIVLGDIASARPAFLYDATKAYADADYAKFKTDSLARQRTLFVAANDGMLHAFYAPNGAPVPNADGTMGPAATPAAGKEGGKEIWAYVPRITMKKLAAQASTDYPHQYTVDGSPELADVQIGGVWKTVLVGGLNDGGRGYYAIDVTLPDQPKPLWELCADSAVCPNGANFPNLGLTYGNPQFGKYKDQWVVYLTSGYNNVPGAGDSGQQVGDGKGYLYVVDVATGILVTKVAIQGDSSSTALGLAKITAISANPASDPVTTYIYGGDNQGGMWRFDMSVTPPTALKMGDAGTGQPITTRPDVTNCAVSTKGTDGKMTASTQRVVAFGTGRLYGVPDITDTTMQSIYVLKDTGVAVAPLRGSTSTLEAETLTRVGATGDYTLSGNVVDLSKKSGWYADFNQNLGERINLDPKIVVGGLNIVTNVPSASTACKVGGNSNVYQFNVCTGQAVRAGAIAGSILSVNSGAVGFIIITGQSGEKFLIATLSNGGQQVQKIQSANAIGAHVTGWRRVRN